MKTEFEATFLKIDKDEIRTRLKNVGAALIYPEFLMKRVVFNPPVQIKGGWLRVRQEADKVTMSLKVADGDKIENQKEIELVINNFDEGVNFLSTIGAQKKSYQETLREKWQLDGVEVTIDTWPGISPFVEIESDNEEAVKRVVEKLRFDYSQAYFGAVDKIYEKEIGIRVDVLNNYIPEITFANPPKGDQ